MWDWLKSLVGLVDKVEPEGSRRLVILTLFSMTIAAAWLVLVSRVAKGPIVWGPGLAFGAFAALFLTIASILSFTGQVNRVTGQVDRVTGQVDRLINLVAHEPKPPAYHIGCRIGRRRLECGLLEVTATTQRLPDYTGNVRIYEVEERCANKGSFHHKDLYECLVDAIAKQIARALQLDARIESIGLAVPGGVQPERGQFSGAVQGVAFKANEHVSSHLATELQQECGSEVLQRVFGAGDSGTLDSDKLTSLIHLDNDARCAARWLIIDRPAWQDFACVFTGAGVGSGLVFDRRIFYGASFRAGEVGHVNLNLGDYLRLGGMDFQARKCSCGTEGYHFESLVSIGGLGHLADIMGGAELDTIRKAYNDDEDRARHLEAVMIDRNDADGLIILDVLVDAVSERSFEALFDRPEISSYLSRVAEQYGKLVSVGIAALLDALDVDHVALCGRIPELLQGNQLFVRAVKAGVAGSVMGAGLTGEWLNFGDMRDWGWRGAALLSRDPGYETRRFPTSMV